MKGLVFEGKTWIACEELKKRDKIAYQSLHRILKEMMRDDPTQGLGKPKQLRYDMSGLWSRRLNEKDRLIYKFDDKYIYIFSIGGHYDQI